MASSQVEIPSSAPFGCVLRDHNRHERRRESRAQAAHFAFQKNLKNLVRGHLQSCISISSDSASDENSMNQISKVDSWVANKEINRQPSLRFTSTNHNKNDGVDSETRKSRIFDRWAAQQARKMVSSIEKQTQEAEELLALSNSPTVSSEDSSSTRENSPVQSEITVEIKSLGASSLVQIWEKRLNNSESMKLNSETSPTGSNSVFSCNENASSVEEAGDSVEEPVIEEAGDSVDERYDAQPKIDDSFADCGSDKMAPTDPSSSSQGMNSGTGESMRVRVADIIKRLIDANQTSSSPTSPWSTDDNEQCGVFGSPSRERERYSILDQSAGQGGFAKFVVSPRIRGRQAFMDLLMQVERDRHKELHSLLERRAVSKFAQKGRIQSLIRLRLLQRGTAVQDPYLQSTTPGASRLSQGSGIRHLRERFNTGVEQGTTSQNDTADPRSTNQESENKNMHGDSSSIPKQLNEETCNQDVNMTEQHIAPPEQNSMSQTSKNVHEEASPNLDSTRQGKRLKARNLDSQEIADTSPSLNVWDEHEKASPSLDLTRQGKRLKARNLDSQETANTSPSLNVWDVHEKTNLSLDLTRQETRLKTRNLDSQETANTSPSLNVWDVHEKANSSLDLTRQGTRLKARNLDSQETANTPPSLNVWDVHEKANSSLDLTRQGTMLKAKNLDPQETIDTFPSLNVWDVHEKASPNLDLTRQGTSLEAKNIDSQETVNTSPSLNVSDVHEASPSLDLTQQETSLEARNLDSLETADTSSSLNVWDENEMAEEVEFNEDEYEEISYDWISDISRPRSYWEDCRKARYLEVLNKSENTEISRLLERRTVSNFLDSDFRERIDRLMVSRLEIQAPLAEEHEDDVQERMDNIMSLLQRQTSQSDSHVEEEAEQEDRAEAEEAEEEVGEENREEAEEEEVREEESLIIEPYHEASDDFDQSSPSPEMRSSSVSRSWSFQDNEVNRDSDHVAYTSPHLTLPSQSSHHNRQQSISSTNHSSIELDLIYDLKGHMEQLHQEMSELRKSIKGCTDMQMMLQQSIKQEVNSVQGGGKKRSYDGAPKKGHCCICYEMQVDSLLYRCGHMCTCLKCAHELQWSSGKCPICRAPIVDVVRVYVDS